MSEAKKAVEEAAELLDICLNSVGTDDVEEARKLYESALNSIKITVKCPSDKLYKVLWANAYIFRIGYIMGVRAERRRRGARG